MTWRPWNGQKADLAMTLAARRAVSRTCYVVLGAALTEVPLDEGTLSKSGRVLMAPDPEPAGAVSFGGGKGTGFPRVPYALRWHFEEANFQHGRKSHYLVDPFNRLVEPTLSAAMKAEGAEDFGR